MYMHRIVTCMYECMTYNMCMCIFVTCMHDMCAFSKKRYNIIGVIMLLQYYMQAIISLLIKCYDICYEQAVVSYVTNSIQKCT